MPTASELVPNKPLTSSEVRELIRADFEKYILAGHSYLNSTAAFGKVSWHLKLTFITEADTSDIEYGSRAMPKNLLQGEGRHLESVPSPESHQLVQPHPLQSAMAKTYERHLTRNVTSPNAERLRVGMPVPVDVKNTDGTMRTENIQYKPDPSMPEDVKTS